MNWAVERDRVSVEALRLEGGAVLAFRATQIRQAQTGLHARIDILQDGLSLAYDVFNVGRHKERVALGNAAYGHLGKSEQQSCPKALFVHHLNDFCSEFWVRWVAQYGVELLTADPDAGPACRFLDPFILEEAGTILFGPPGRGKSYIAMLMAQSVHHGVRDFWPVTQVSSLFVNLERGAASLRQRLTGINFCLGLAPQDGLPTINARGMSLAQLRSQIQAAITERKVRLVFLDSISRSGYGSLVGDDVANSVMDTLNSLGVAWLAIAHTSKADDGKPFGSQMFEAAADITVRLVSERKDDGTIGVGLEVDKANDIARPKMQQWALEFDQHGLSAFRRARPGEFGEVEGGQKKGLAERVRDYVLEHGTVDASETADKLGASRDKVHAILMGEGYVSPGKDGKRRLFALRADERGHMGDTSAG